VTPLKTRAQAALLYQMEEKKQRLFNEFVYAAKTWKRRRRIIVKAGVNPLGPNTRYVVTNLKGGPQKLYDKLYCARGSMKLCIGGRKNGGKGRCVKNLEIE
jgi:DDE family transposase